MSFDFNDIENFKVLTQLYLKRPELFESNALREIVKNILESEYQPNIIYLLDIVSENSKSFDLFKDIFFVNFIIQILHRIINIEMSINLLKCIHEDADFIKKIKPPLISYFKNLNINQSNILKLLAMFSEKPILFALLFDPLCNINNKLIEEIKNR